MNTNFDSILLILENLTSKIDELKDIILSSSEDTSIPKGQWLNVDDLCAYLPSHPKVQTVYSWTCAHKIPFHKKGRSIMFDKAEIDEWLQDNEHFQSGSDLESDAREFVNSKRNNSLRR